MLQKWFCSGYKYYFTPDGTGFACRSVLLVCSIQNINVQNNTTDFKKYRHKL